MCMLFQGLKEKQGKSLSAGKPVYSAGVLIFYTTSRDSPMLVLKLCTLKHQASRFVTVVETHMKTMQLKESSEPNL